MGEVPRLLGPYGEMGAAELSRNPEKACGNLIREAPQGQLNLAYPTGIRAEALAFGSKAPYRVVV